MPSDFAPQHNTPEAFLGEVYARQIAHIDDGEDIVYSVIHMTEREVRDSILDDILAATMWEHNFKQTLKFDLEELLRFIPNEHRQLVIDQLNHPEIVGLYAVKDGEYRINDNPAVLQAAMDYCGVWYDGFTPPDNEVIIGISREKCEEVLKVHGSVENLAHHLAVEMSMDQAGNTPTTTTVQ